MITKENNRPVRARNRLGQEVGLKVKHVKSKTPNGSIDPSGRRRLARRGAKPAGARSNKWVLRLYIAGQTPKAITAFRNLKLICEEELKGKYSIQVINLLENPKLARDNQILAVPALVRKLPLPVRKIIGDLSDRERVLVGLDIVGKGVLSR